MEFDIQVYQTTKGKRPFSEWLESLRDEKGRIKVRLRLDRLVLGNFGDCKHVDGHVHELRIDFGPGYRVFFGKVGKTCVLLLTGGNKRTQSKDIKMAIQYFADYSARRDD
ncbi:MAG: type II toxin-antitoxin system RelE/ParE family toxin [Chlamydiales bacterium]